MGASREVIVSLVLFSLLSAAWAQTVAPGATVADAVSIQVTPTGLNSVADLVSVVAPERTDLDPIHRSGSNYSLSIENAWVGMTLDDARIVPRAGALDIQIDLTVWLNEVGDLFDLAYELDLLFTTVDEDCDTRIAPFPVWVAIPATFAVVGGAEGNHIDVSLGEIVLTHGLTSAQIDPELDCDLTTIDTILGFLGLSFIDLLIEQAEPFIREELESQRQDLEAQLQEALSAARYADTVDLAGAALDVSIEPREVVVTAEGLDIRAQGRVHAERAACMDAYDPGGSTRTDSPVPAVSALPAGTHLAMVLSDELVDQALYAVWRSGVLCYDLGSQADSLPIPMSTALLGILGGEGFTAIFPEERPIDLLTAPRRPPMADYQGDDDLTIVVRELGVDFYTEVDHRKARALGVDIEADVGVTLAFDATTGVLDAGLDLSDEAIGVVTSHNELVAGTDEAVAANFDGVLDVVIGQVVGDALSGASFGLPAMEGIGLTSLAAGAAGGGDWLAVRATLGAVTYDNSDDEGGCGGCSGGCATTPGGPGWLAVFVPLLWWRRRR